MDKSARWLSRSEAAKQLNMSVSNLRLLEGKSITPEFRGGKHYFKREDVAILALKLNRENVTGGAIAAVVFQAFEDKHSFTRIVLEHRLDPLTVRQLYYEWKTDLESGFHRMKTEKALSAKQLREQEETRAKDEQRKDEFHNALLSKIEVDNLRNR